MKVNRFSLGMASAYAALMAGMVAAIAQNPAPQPPPYQPIPIPDLTGFWQHGPIAIFEPLPFKASPVQLGTSGADVNNVNTALEGDYTNPLLRPEAAAAVKRHGEEARAGRPVPSMQEECRLSGVPNVLTLPAPMVILQQPDKVVMVFQRDHQIRHIYLNQPHSANPRTSWYGDSVGWYEGDTLVVDTIGMNAKTPVDMLGTPHSETLHVVERYRVINNGRTLEVVFTADDPKTFTSEYSGRILYPRSNATIIDEEICAENNRLPSGVAFYEIPTETKEVF